MKKSELAAEVAAEANVSKSNAMVVIDAMIAVTRKYLLDHDEALLPGLGKLAIVTRSAREGRNPKTGEAVHIPARATVKFKPSSELKDSINAEVSGGL